MLKNLSNVLNRPFPLIETKQEKLFLSLTIGFFIFAFLLIFQPFGFSKLGNEKIVIFIGYGVVTFIVELFFTFVLMNYFNQFYNAERWTLGKHLINVLLLITSLAFFNWLFTVWIKYPNYDSFIPFLVETLAIGFFPLIFIFLYLERKLRLTNLKLSDNLNTNLSVKRQNRETAKTPTTINIEGIEINSENFLYAKSLGNYVELNYVSSGEINNEIVRTTMKKIEDRLCVNSEIVRCHKSYFVNIKKVTEALGNARSLYFIIEGVEIEIPVSRKMIKTFLPKVS
jgi:hypothetical protein